MKKISFLFVLGFLAMSFSSFSQLKIDASGNTTVKYGNFSSGNDAILYFGDTNHYIKSVFGYGIKFGSAGVPDILRIKQWGTIGIKKDPDSSFSLDVNGTIRVNSTTYTSDERLKKDIVKLENPISKIKQVEGFSYRLINEEEIRKNSQRYKKNKNFGFMAQNFKEIFPELVYEDDEGYLSVDYVSMIPVLIEAIKEQQDLIEKLTIKVTSIEENCCDTDTKSASILTGVNCKQGTEEAKLYQNTPNPFSNKTEIKYYIPIATSNARIFIYNMQGNQLKQYEISRGGNQTLTLNGSELTPGMYFYSLVIDGKEIDTKKMILTK